ncbi:MAG: NADH-quinone oxidoreductase subunit D [Planctomycetes bacterium]|nr:NADH-quinone oxidoreductase subunit D [Planctomycetota bacterium]
MPSKELETQDMLLNMGPQHPSTHGVLRLVLRTDGELVSDVTPVVGYLHRCAEKIGENLRYEQYVPYTDRMDYLSSMSDNLALCLAVERLMKIEIPPRAQYIRVIMAELNRIASHLLAFGTFGLDVGAFTPFLYAWREREMILNMFEYVCGARLTYNYMKVGGVWKDVDKKFAEMVNNFLSIFDDKLKEYNDLLSYNQIFITRTKGLGVIPRDMALAWGLSGPIARASGIEWDLRRAEPYSSYDKFEFRIPVGRPGIGVVGDCWNRYFVRIEEMVESGRILRQALDGLPSGKFSADVKRGYKVPAGEAYTVIENPRGELGFYIISDGSDTPLRVKIRAPSFVNLSVLPEISRGVLIADLIAILGSIDIVLGEIDR